MNRQDAKNAKKQRHGGGPAGWIGRLSELAVVSVWGGGENDRSAPITACARASKKAFGSIMVKPPGARSRQDVKSVESSNQVYAVIAPLGVLGVLAVQFLLLPIGDAAGSNWTASRSNPSIVASLGVLGGSISSAPDRRYGGEQLDGVPLEPMLGRVDFRRSIA